MRSRSRSRSRSRPGPNSGSPGPAPREVSSTDTASTSQGNAAAADPDEVIGHEPDMDKEFTQPLPGTSTADQDFNRAVEEWVQQILKEREWYGRYLFTCKMEGCTCIARHQPIRGLHWVGNHGDYDVITWILPVLATRGLDFTFCTCALLEIKFTALFGAIA